MAESQITRRITALEKSVQQLRAELEYQHAVDGIRRGLESAARGEGESARKAFDRVRRKYRIRKVG